jgi:hypothetical protein
LLLNEKCEWNFLKFVSLACGTEWMAKALIKVIINQLTSMWKFIERKIIGIYDFRREKTFFFCCLFYDKEVEKIGEVTSN